MNRIRYPLPSSKRISRESQKRDAKKSDLQERQVRATERGAIATAALSAALVALTFLQWHTSESTARIERAKAQPHFKVVQTPQNGLSGFIAKDFQIEAIAGVADASESTASEIFLIHFWSKQLNLRGICRASSRTFFAYGDDLMSYSISDEAHKLIGLSSEPSNSDDGYTIQPLSTMFDVSFTDIFEDYKHRYLYLIGGRSTQLGLADFSANGWTNMDLSFQLDNKGLLNIFRVNKGSIPQDCANALRVLSLRKGIAISSYYVFISGDTNLVTKDGNIFVPGDIRISSDNPRPLYLTKDEKGEVVVVSRTRSSRTSYALPSMVPIE